MTYINKDALLDRLTQIAEASENPAYLIAMRTAMAEVACAPEGLVRCRDCARYTKELAGRPITWCCFHERITYLNDFCSDGEPKGDAE